MKHFIEKDFKTIYDAIRVCDYNENLCCLCGRDFQNGCSTSGVRSANEREIERKSSCSKSFSFDRKLQRIRT